MLLPHRCLTWRTTGLFHRPLYVSEGSCWLAEQNLQVLRTRFTDKACSTPACRLIQADLELRLSGIRNVQQASGFFLLLLLLLSGFILERGTCSECRRCSELRCGQKGSPPVRFCCLERSSQLTVACFSSAAVLRRP